MPKASIIIPVYNAQKTLRKCVESIVFGQEQDVEIILVEDRSKDGSWELCKQLESAYPQVRAVQNERNSGPSFTRNRGLDEATGRYVLFVDSDDWVSGAYTKKLLDAQAMHSDRLVICGYAFLDYVSDRRRTYGVCENGDETRTLPGDAYFSLVDEILIQQLWNKVFERKIIQEKGIRFDVDLSMGEDFQFVIDYLREAKVDGCVVINAPLYYYTRRSKGSLMSRWAELSTLEQSIGRLRQVETICGNHSAAKGPIENTRNQFAGRVVSDRKLTKAEKLQQLEAIWQDGQAPARYRCQQKALLREKLAGVKCFLIGLLKRTKGYLARACCKVTVERAKRHLRAEGVTVISQNCIGGVFYHDMGLQFRSPTVNAFVAGPEFMKLVLELPSYMACEIVMRWGEEYPIGSLGDAEIHFVHYDTCEEAKEAWNKRKERINWNRIFVIGTDRDGFDEACYAQWRQIPYPKLLLTAHPEYEEDAICFHEYSGDGQVGDLITNRKFYRKGVLIQKINGCR
jgi:uncharacterized protein (DUF1919 family)